MKLKQGQRFKITGGAFNGFEFTITKVNHNTEYCYQCVDAKDNVHYFSQINIEYWNNRKELKLLK